MPRCPALSSVVLGRGVRTLLILLVAATFIYGMSFFGRVAAILAALGVLIAFGMVLFWLPRAAHKAFRLGNYPRAKLIYRILGRSYVSVSARAAVDVSIAACEIARADFDSALEWLARVNVDQLSDAAKAAWHNNRAYALARGGTDPDQALNHIEAAIGLRPDVAGFRHTRGVVLLSLGRTDEAIRVLDDLWNELAGNEKVAMLEAERCYDLGRAWRTKGEHDYATDYFERARRAAPESSWAVRASEHLPAGLRRPEALAEFIEA